MAKLEVKVINREPKSMMIKDLPPGSVFRTVSGWLWYLTKIKNADDWPLAVLQCGSRENLPDGHAEHMPLSLTVYPVKSAQTIIEI